MAPFNASIWSLIEDKKLKYALTTFEKGRTFFLKRVVAVDGLNQGHNEGRAPVTFAEQRTNLGRRLIQLCLLGARPVVFLDGRHASPGSGKYKQHAARAAVSPRFAIPPKDDAAFYRRRSRIWDRDALGDDFSDHRVQLKDDAEDFGFLALRNFRRRVRAATFPRGILEARSPEDAYRWASSKFGGGLLPPIDSARGKKLMKKFRKVRALSKKGLL